jgi:hypothetical protein
MKRSAFVCLPALVLLACGLVDVGNAATQTVTFQVTEVNALTVSGNPAALIVSSATAGSQPTAATNALTTYAITTNHTAEKVTGVLSAAMPANTTLSIALVAPTGGTSAGTVTLTAVAADLVTGIVPVAESGKTITYTFSATIAAGILSSDTRTVTLTLTDGV